MENHIKHIEIKGLFGEKNISFSPNKDVNILVGINGSGKSTLLQLINSIRDVYAIPDQIIPLNKTVPLLSAGLIFKNLKTSYDKGEIKFDNDNVLYSILIDTFDAKVKDKSKLRKNDSFLDFQLRYLIDGNIYENTFVKFALKKYKDAYNSKTDEVKVIQDFQNLVNEFFASTNKKLIINEENKFSISKCGKKTIELESLSSGEKQLLIIFLNILLLDKKPTIVLLDEPEVTLHILWQRKLIHCIFRINPNIQLFIATHASSIFFNSYEDKIFRMEEISFPMKKEDAEN